MFLPKRRLIASAVLLALVFFLLFLTSRDFSYTLRASATDAAALPLGVVNAAAHELKAFLFFHKSYWENFGLRRRNDELAAQVRQLQDLALENERLRQTLELKNNAPYHSVAASVIGRDFNALRPYVVLNKGSASGVKKYAPVVTYGGLAGKVLETGRFSCKVMLINDPDLAVPAMNLRTREQGLVSGTLDGRCKLRFLDADSDIREGDEVVTSGLNMTYPEGIPIGRVKFVGVEPSGIGKFAILEPALNVATLDEVLVVIPHE